MAYWKSWCSLAFCVAVLLIRGPAFAAATPACNEVFVALHAAEAARDRAGIWRWAVESNNAPDCDSRPRDIERRAASRILVALADAARSAGASDGDLRNRYQDAAMAGATWEALVALGDIALAERDWKTAAERYNNALNAMAALFAEEPAVPGDLRDKIKRRAGEMVMLAPMIPEPTRAGDPGGIDMELAPTGTHRAGVPIPRPLPTFFYATEQMHAESRDYLMKWLDSLRGAPIKELVLTGHADVQGDPVKDEALSLRRAEAVAAIVQRAGISVKVFGFGRRCDLEFTAAYDDGAKNTIRRRVEVLPGTTLPDGYCHNVRPWGE